VHAAATAAAAAGIAEIAGVNIAGEENDGSRFHGEEVRLSRKQMTELK